MRESRIEPSAQGITQVQYEGNINANGSTRKSISQPEDFVNTTERNISESVKPSLRNPTDAELIFNADGETVGEREQIAAFKKTSLAYENAARSEAILRVKVRQKTASIIHMW